MNALVFVDSNVFLYAVDAGETEKQPAAAAWRAALWRTRRGRISFQVLQEFYVKATRKWPKAADATRAEIYDLMAWKPVVVGAGVLLEAWKIQDRYRFSFWDSLIVSAAKAASCRFVLTEDLQHGQNLDGIEIISPFRSDPSLLE